MAPTRRKRANLFVNQRQSRLCSLLWSGACIVQSFGCIEYVGVNLSTLPLVIRRVLILDKRF